MIQFKIQFKTKSRIFIQKNIHTIEYRIFNRTIHSKDLGKIIQSSNKRPNYGFGALHRTLYGSRTPEMDLKGPTELFEMSLNYCVTQLKLNTVCKLSSTIFCCLHMCQASATPDQISTFSNIYRYTSPILTLYQLIESRTVYLV